MKRVVALVSILMTGIALATAQSQVKGHQYTLTGEIINSVELPPGCGTIAWGIVIEFKIISFTDTKYKGNEIGIVFTCPEFYGDDFFKAGRKYEVQLADENQASFGWTIINENSLSKYHIGYTPYALSAKRLDLTTH